MVMHTLPFAPSKFQGNSLGNEVVLRQSCLHTHAKAKKLSGNAAVVQERAQISDLLSIAAQHSVFSTFFRTHNLFLFHGKSISVGASSQTSVATP